MQLGSDAQIPDGLLAAMTLLNEKPHQGVPSWNLALHQGIDERNCTAAIGIRASAQLNRVRPRYTGKERDAESGLDYFGARYYGSSMGRFMSPDWNSQPDEIPYADIRNPQSLNLYSYVKNNPLRQADPDGHCCVEEEEATETGAEIGAEIGTFFEPGGGTAVGGAIGGLVGLGLGIYADYKIAHYLTHPSINMMGKGGNQNHSESDFEHLSDKELSDLIKDPTTSTNDRQKAVTEQKSRATRNAAKRGAKEPKAAPVKNDPASVRARQQQAQPVLVPLPAPAPPPPDPPKPPKDDHGDHPNNQ